MRELLEKRFKFNEYGTTISTEIVAGLSLYLSLAYIFIVNPAILSKAGIPSGAVFFATVLASAIATLVMGWFARLPFALAPGLESNGFFTFVVVISLGFTWQEGLGLVFWSGVLCIIFTIIPIRQKIIDSIPSGLKTAISATVGIFVATIGLVITDVLVFENGVPKTIGSFSSDKAMLLYLGFTISVLLGIKKLKFHGGMLVAIIAATILAKVLGVSSDTPPADISEFLDGSFKLELFSVFKDPRAWTVLLIFFVIDFYGSIGKFIGLTASTNLYSNGQVKNMKQALYVDGGATVFGSLIGTSTVITYVESAVAIATGGRTGLVAIVCGLLMLMSLAFTPLVGYVPVAATSGVLVYVGYLLLPTEQMRTGYIQRFDLAVTLSMGIVALFTFSLDKSLLLGFFLYTAKQIVTKEKLNPYLLGTTLLLSLAMGLQYFGIDK